MSISNFFSGNRLVRSSHLRSKISIKTAKPQKIIAFLEGKPLFNEAFALKYLEYEALSPFIISTPPVVFLGIDTTNSDHYFALDSTNMPTLVKHLETQGSFLPLRPHVFNLETAQASLIAESLSLLDWNRRNTSGKEAGWKKVCENVDCSASKSIQNVSYPRTDPVVIVCVVDNEKQKVLLGRQKVWPAKMYSSIAGFVEPEACAREVSEETDISITNIKYHSSQPWPFPAQLIFGCHAEAVTNTITRTDAELEDARWFDKADVIKAFQGKNDDLLISSRSGTSSISYQLLKAWAFPATKL